MNTSIRIHHLLALTLMGGACVSDGSDNGRTTQGILDAGTVDEGDSGTGNGEAGSGADAGDAPTDAGEQGTDTGGTGSSGNPTTAESGGSDTTTDSGGAGELVPPAGMSSGGSGGQIATSPVAKRTRSGGVDYYLISHANSGKQRAMIVYSGIEGGMRMAQNLAQFIAPLGYTDVAIGVLDGVQYRGNGEAGAVVLDELREDYDIDNDATWLFSESAGTTAGFALGFDLRPSWFAAYWANDVNASDVPKKNATELGFAPWGGVGPGGAFQHANVIAQGMTDAGYRTVAPHPYNGPGSDQHGHPQQLIYVMMSWLNGKRRD